jgi:hypothetical protein
VLARCPGSGEFPAISIRCNARVTGSVGWMQQQAHHKTSPVCLCRVTGGALGVLPLERYLSIVEGAVRPLGMDSLMAMALQNLVAVAGMQSVRSRGMTFTLDSDGEASMRF